ncbi:MAG: DNA ligase D [Chloroflexi bacterium]|nr:DNA ligase D [Chloroflexota bacterium]
MLDEYRKKRKFERTPEPAPERKVGEGPLIFVVQKHNARRLHYDFRLEVDGALKSWSVPNGPSLDPSKKRLAVMVEDHPIAYASFEGVIPQGEYGAGQVIVWDTGAYSLEEHGRVIDERQLAHERIGLGLAAGKISFRLNGHKLKGSWALVKMKRGDNNWLLLKHQDEFADPERDILNEESSVISGLTIENLKEGRNVLSVVKENSPPGAVRAPFAEHVSPMLATLADAPFSSPEWVFEAKLDGIRAISLIRDGTVRLLSRRGLDITHQYPALTKELGHQTVGELVLDGEIVALDKEGRPSFQLLQNRLNLTREADILRAEAGLPVFYYVFDILYLDGFDLSKVALHHRKALLLHSLRTSAHVRLLDYFEKDGETVYQTMVENGFEGAVGKRLDSIYEAGRRSQNWLKIKSTTSDDFVIGGFTQGQGARAHVFGSLLLGYYDDEGHLIYAGHVGTGFDERTLHDLWQRLNALKTDRCPFARTPPLNAPTTWVRPELAAEVKFAQWTGDGLLRVPVFMRLRDDKAPSGVRLGRVVTTSAYASLPVKDVQKASVESVLHQLKSRKEALDIEVEGHKIGLSNLDKVLWPPLRDRRALIKRDLLAYFAAVSPYVLPHLRDRPLTLSRYPDGINGEHFWQKHWANPLPAFVETVRVSEHGGAPQEYLMCGNLATLLWLGQLADIELHTWFSRMSPDPDMGIAADLTAEVANRLADYPDFIIFDIDPYIYAGKEAKGAEPELNRAGFAKACEVALWLRESLDALTLFAFVKTSGRTGLHVYVPVTRRLDYAAVRSAAETISLFLQRKHPREITVDWAVEKRTGKIFVDYNQNVRGKTLASVYSPRPTLEATVSMPLRWDELGKVYPTDFTILNVPERLSEMGDLWAGILEAKRDLGNLLKLPG